MRKINTILVLIIMLLLTDHIVFACMHLLGLNAGVLKPLAMMMMLFTVLHAIVSLIVTIRAEKVGINTKARYSKENKEFWARRVSGMFILVLALLHGYIMFKNEKGVPRIASMPKVLSFATPLLIIFILIHIMTNVKPLLISLGVKNIDKKERIIKLILTVFLLFALGSYIYFTVSRIRGN